MEMTQIIINYGGDENGAFLDLPFHYAYWLNVEKTFTAFSTDSLPILAAKVNNGAYRFIHVQLYENILGEYVAHPQIHTELSFDPHLFYYGGAGVKQVVRPRKSFLMKLGFLPHRAGSREVALSHDFVGRYRLEIVGPALVDSAGNSLPQIYHQPLDIFGTTRWIHLWGLTIADQILMPIWKSLHTKNNPWQLLNQLVKLGAILYKSLGTGSFIEGSTILLVNLMKELAKVLENPDNLTVTEEKNLVQSIRSQTNVAATLKRIFLWIDCIEKVAIPASLMAVHPIDNYLIDIPARYKTAIKTFPTACITGVTQRTSSELSLEWLERLLFLYDGGIQRFDTRRPFLANGILEMEQGASGTIGPRLRLTDIVAQQEDESWRTLWIDIVLKCQEDETGQRILHPELWDPEVGSGPVGLGQTNGLGDLWVADHLGRANIEIAVINNSPSFQYEAQHQVSTATMPIGVIGSNVIVEIPLATSVKVGERVVSLNS